jgi:hypothetical protein
MSLITRILPPNNKNSKLTFVEMDNNLYYLQSIGVSGVTFSANTLTLINPTGGTKSVLIDNFTALTISGDLVVTGNATLDTLSATTFSTSNYENLPVSGLTEGSNINISGDNGNFTISVTGITNGLNSVSANTGLDIINGDTLYTIYNSTLDPSLQMENSVGGLPSGTAVSSLTSNTLVDLFDSILFPTANPTYTIPTITLTGVASQTLEVGSTYSPNIGLYGIKNDAGDFHELTILRDGGSIFSDSTLNVVSATDVPDQFGYVNPNNPNYGYYISPLPYSESYVIPAPNGINQSTTTTYKGSGDYYDGFAKLNNKGNLDTRPVQVRSINAPQGAGTNFETSTYTITGIYPYFYGTSPTIPTAETIANAISGGTATKVLSSASGTLSIPYNINNEFLWVAYFENYTTKTKWFVTTLNNGDIDNSFITTATLKSNNSPTGLWSDISFKVHWSVYSTTLSTLEFKNS